MKRKIISSTFKLYQTQKHKDRFSFVFQAKVLVFNVVYDVLLPELSKEVWLHGNVGTQWLPVYGVHRQGFEEDAEADGAGGDWRAG